MDELETGGEIESAMMRRMDGQTRNYDLGIENRLCYIYLTD